MFGQSRSNLRPNYQLQVMVGSELDRDVIESTLLREKKEHNYANN
jgi:hypothetical protein